MTDSPFMTPGEVAAVFGVSPETIANWADDGKLEHVRTPGGHRRFRRTSVEQLLEASLVPGPVTIVAERAS